MDEMHFDLLEDDAFAKQMIYDNQMRIFQNERRIIENVITLMDLLSKMVLLLFVMTGTLSVAGCLGSKTIFITIFTILISAIVVCQLVKLKYKRKQSRLEEYIDKLEVQHVVESINKRKGYDYGL